MSDNRGESKEEFYALDMTAKSKELLVNWINVRMEEAEKLSEALNKQGMKDISKEYTGHTQAYWNMLQFIDVNTKPESE